MRLQALVRMHLIRGYCERYKQNEAELAATELQRVERGRAARAELARVAYTALSSSTRR